jgi:uncharacterized OB-fold protein
MSTGVTIWRCESCRAAYYPEPLLCPRCRGEKFATERVHEAIVEEISVIRHMIGQENWQPRRIASVLTSAGPRITVGLRDESEPGTIIELFEEGTTPFGKAKS